MQQELMVSGNARPYNRPAVLGDTDAQMLTQQPFNVQEHSAAKSEQCAKLFYCYLLLLYDSTEVFLRTRV